MIVSPSESLSSFKTSSAPSPDPVLLTVAPALTVSVSLTPTGSSLIPFTVIVIFPSASSVPSFTLYSKYSFTVSLLSKASAAAAVAAYE